MKKLLALAAALCLGWSMLGCAENKAPAPKPVENAPAPGAPGGEAKPEGTPAPTEPAPPEEKK